MAITFHQVLSGPSREELMDALRLADENRTVEISWVSSEHEILKKRFLVTGAKVGEQRGRSWVIKGHDPDIAAGCGDDVFLQYDTVTRKGKLAFELP